MIWRWNGPLPGSPTKSLNETKDLSQIVLVGIKTRGVYISRIQERLSQLEQIDVPVAELDAKPFRDDMKATEDTTVLPVDIAHREVIWSMMSSIQVARFALPLIIWSVTVVLLS